MIMGRCLGSLRSFQLVCILVSVVSGLNDTNVIQVGIDLFTEMSIVIIRGHL